MKKKEFWEKIEKLDQEAQAVLKEGEYIKQTSAEGFMGISLQEEFKNTAKGKIFWVVLLPAILLGVSCFITLTIRSFALGYVAELYEMGTVIGTLFFIPWGFLFIALSIMMIFIIYEAIHPYFKNKWIWENRKTTATIVMEAVKKQLLVIQEVQKNADKRLFEMKNYQNLTQTESLEVLRKVEYDDLAFIDTSKYTPLLVKIHKEDVDVYETVTKEISNYHKKIVDQREFLRSFI